MIKQMINIILRLLAVFLSRVVLAVSGFIVGSTVFAIFGFEFNGRQGYEAVGAIGFIPGAPIRLFPSSVLLFRKRTGK